MFKNFLFLPKNFYFINYTPQCSVSTACLSIMFSVYSIISINLSPWGSIFQSSYIRILFKHYLFFRDGEQAKKLDSNLPKGHITNKLGYKPRVYALNYSLLHYVTMSFSFQYFLCGYSLSNTFYCLCGNIQVFSFCSQLQQ